MIIMITDGIINHLEGENKEEILGDYIGQLDIASPQETANAILKYAMAGSKYVINDGMDLQRLVKHVGYVCTDGIISEDSHPARTYRFSRI